ncbi:MAG TPA: NUDIX domain-containing protein [Acidimicrobiales bacterium]|jgi:predicted NUDIX family NTP pyrophosphohydrolase|nr:NUDIX domain-containing protein [Acidimicrobiales bacterium]
MGRRSAGILVYRRTGRSLELLLVHPGGPLWSRRDDGAWSIPKGEHEGNEAPLAAARREFREELGQDAPGGPVIDLGEVRQRGGKVVRAFGIEGDLDVASITSSAFHLEWPPGSGVVRDFPEVDRAAWFPPEEARRKLVAAQVPLVDRLLEATDA